MAAAHQLPRILLSFLVAVLVVGCAHNDAPTPAPHSASSTRDNHLALGNPSGATTDVNQPTNYLVAKPQYTLSYHRDRGIPNWVSWHLSAAWLGATPRQDDFATDPTLPSGWYRVSSTSYTGSGFDRGHQCPSADRTGSIADNSATFLMTNMVPQAPRSNQQMWAGLEDYCRTLVGAGNELYIVCGSYGRGGTGSNGYTTTLDNGRVTVPARLWKVVVVLPVGTNDVSRVMTSTRIIALDSPNDNSLNTAWGGYRTSVDFIEQATGLDLLSAVPGSVQSALEARVDAGPTQ